MKQPLSLLVAAVAATACAPAVPAGEFRIVGKIENVPDGAVVRLYEPQGQMLRGIGVDTLAGGRFSFRDTVVFPKVVQISVTVGDYRGGTLDVWVAPGKRIEVRGEDKQAWLWEAASDIAEQADEDMYRALVEPQICELNWFQDMLNTQQDFARYMELFGQVSEKTVRRMQTAPVTRVWLNKLAECARLLQFGIGTAHKAEMLALYDRMTEEQRQSPMGRRIDAYLNPAPAVGVGDRLVDGDLYDADGNLHRLAEFIGKYILLDFWSAGCGPCVQAIPELQEIVRKYAGRVAVVSISQDPKPVWKEFIAEKQLVGNQWNELVDGDTRLGMRYGVKEIPHFVLIAPDGRIQDVWQGYGKGSLLEKMEQNIK